MPACPANRRLPLDDARAVGAGPACPVHPGYRSLFGYPPPATLPGGYRDAVAAAISLVCGIDALSSETAIGQHKSGQDRHLVIYSEAHDEHPCCGYRMAIV
jgi:hypothetical protein